MTSIASHRTSGLLVRRTKEGSTGHSSIVSFVLWIRAAPISTKIQSSRRAVRGRDKKMSHGIVSSDQRLVYIMPAWPSDVLRSREFDRFFQSYCGASFSVQTRDGWYWFSCPLEDPAFTASFASRKKLDLVIGESTENALAKVFLEGDLDMQGDMTVLLSVAEYVLRHSSGLSRSLVQIISRVSFEWFKGLTGSRTNAARNKWRTTDCPSDLPVNFFQLWLGPSLGHSCAQFQNCEDDLEAANHHGLQRVCEQLDLTENDCLLDLSCGWGNLLLHATAQYGIEAQGVTANEQQAIITTERICRNHVERRCKAEFRDLGGTPLVANTFQKIVDISLFDQVLLSHFHEYLTCTYRMLAPGGLLLLHRMTRGPKLSGNTVGIRYTESPKPVEVGSLSEELQIAESLGFHVISLEDLGKDLRHTLRLWIDQLQGSSQSQAATQYRNYRTWLFHLLDTATNLEAGSVQFHQIIFRRPADSDATEGIWGTQCQWCETLQSKGSAVSRGGHILSPEANANRMFCEVQS